MMKNKRIGIWGWWQGNNLGDHWIRDTLLSAFPYSNAVNTTIKDFKEYDFIICGGGGLFIRDVISPWNDYAQMVPFGIFGMGAEFPHNNFKAKELAKVAKFFYVRDIYSMKCMNLDRSALSYDVTFLNPLSYKTEYKTKKNIFLIWREPTELINYLDFKKYIGPISLKKDWINNLFSLNYNYFEDEFTQNKEHLEISIPKADIIISGRYHGIIAAIQSGTPCIGIDIVPKIRALMEEVGIEEYCLKLDEVKDLKLKLLALEKNKNSIRKRMLLFRENAKRELEYQVTQMKKIIY